MNLELGGPGPGCSSMRVRRLLSGELGAAEAQRTEAHLAECARCAEVRRELLEEREALRRDVPFPRFAAAVAEKLAQQRPSRASWSRWTPLLAAAALALVAGSLLVRRPADTETVRSKGAGSAQLFVQDAAGVRELGRDEPVARGARLLVRLRPSGRKHAAAVLIEPGETSVLYDGPALNGPLPQAFEWTGNGAATLLVVLSDSPLRAAALRSPADAPRGSDVWQVRLRR